MFRIYKVTRKIKKDYHYLPEISKTKARIID